MNRQSAPFAASVVMLLLTSACAGDDDGARASGAPTVVGVSGPALPLVAPDEAGLSEEALALITPAMQEHVTAGRLPGVVTLVALGGRIVHWQAIGMRDIEAADPLEPDDIFRIYSMTKPVTSVAIMMLVEDGRVGLDDLVSHHLPAFADLSVLEEDGSRTPMSPPMTIRHLLSHNGGLTYGIFGDTPVDRAYMSSGLFAAQSLPEYVGIVAGLPLAAQPGERWNYSVSTDVLGYIVEIASGQSFAEFLEERILQPLGMDDTAFWVPEAKRDRFTTHYAGSEDGLAVVDSPAEGRFTQAPGLASGGGGLVSTASDYVRFAQMMLQDGQLDGVRILRSETVQEMRRNQLSESAVPIALAGWFPPAYGFGLGFATLIDHEATPEADHDGVFRWGGVANTFFWIDPEAELIAMVWTQMDPFLVHGLERQFQALVYSALGPDAE
ncbi:MAG: beta-lactamase family protein [Gemmatimonadota bacterium]|nr:beta-lactamase family protein [Gemmatimonadota bacterium]